jgi:type II secretory pathway pseudopilin PulG
MIEVLVSMLVLIVGLLGVLTTVIGSGNTITAGERSAAMAQVGQQTLQSVESLSYANAADSSAPIKTSTTDTTNPTYYLSSTGCVGGSCYQWDPTSSSSVEPLAIDTVYGKVAPGPTNVVVPSPTGSGCTVTTTTTNCQMTFAVYVFITDSTSPVCSQTGVTCTSTTSYKRITVAVKNTGVGGPLQPVYLSTFISNKSGGAGNPLTLGTTTCTDGATSVTCTH